MLFYFSFKFKYTLHLNLKIKTLIPVYFQLFCGIYLNLLCIPDSMGQSWFQGFALSGMHICPNLSLIDLEFLSKADVSNIEKKLPESSNPCYSSSPLKCYVFVNSLTFLPKQFIQIIQFYLSICFKYFCTLNKFHCQ